MSDPELYTAGEVEMLEHDEREERSGMRMLAKVTLLVLLVACFAALVYLARHVWIP